MSGNRSLERVLTQAKEKEKRYDWLPAAKLYIKAQKGMVKQRDFCKAGEFQEKIGHCFHRAAMQAESQDEFKKRMQHAVEAYQTAQEFYEDMVGKQKTPRKLRCNAIIKYLNYWLASKPSEKKKLLDDCLALEEKALGRFLESRDLQEYVRTYSELSLVFFCRAFLEWNRQTLKSILEKGLEWGKKVVEKPSELGDTYEIAGTYFTLATCLSDAGFYLISESEDIDISRLEAVKYLNQAAELAEKVSNTLLLGLSHLWLGINGGEEEAEKHYEKALESGEQTRDNFLVANGLDYLAYNTYWRALATEDPVKRRELAEKAMRFYDKALKRYSIISFLSPRGGFIGAPSGQAEHYYTISRWETNTKKKSELLEKSMKVGMEALNLAENSDMPMIIAQVLHVISKTLQAQAQLMDNPREKRNRLEKALKYREKTIEIFGDLTPFFSWNLGVMMNYLSEIKAELADIEPNLETKRTLLEEATQSKEECLELCNSVMPYFERKGETALFAGLQSFQNTYVTLLTRLYDLTKKPIYLRKTIDVLQEAIKSASKLDMVSLIAESYWKIAKAHDTLGEHLAAAKSFSHASESYNKAAEKVQQLEVFYQDHATYMKAWNEIEKAKANHAEKQYGQAKEHYEKAANLHKSTSQWRYLSLNYLGLSRLEDAEYISRKEQTQEAIRLFQKAAKLFYEAKKTLQAAEDRIEDIDERDLANRLVKASGIREGYCLGRVSLEEAKILGRRGDNAASSKKYELAAKKFQKVMNTIERESSFTKATITKDRQELMPIIYLCRAWQTMKKAEAEASPKLYLRASELFDEAKKYSFNEKTKLLALGHSHFCKALNAGTRFEDSGDTKLYFSATQHIDNAAKYYVKAGFKIASEYAIATQRLFDAYIYMANAKKETDPGKKARYYIVAEKVLKTSIGSYLKAKHPAKSEQVQWLLERVREERKLAVSLSELLDVPTITSSTASFVTPTPTEETAVGLEKFEHANVQANLIIPVKRIQVGEDFHLKIQIVNVGKQTILLDKVEGIFPSGFRLVTKPSYCLFEDKHLNMMGKRLAPLKTEEIRLTLRAFDKGSFKIELRITYINEAGNQLVSELEPMAIEVSKVVLPKRIATGYKVLDALLFGGIPENYAVILTSPYCDERELIIKEFLETGAKEGQVTFHISTKVAGVENLDEEFQSNFYLFICNPQADAIVKSSPNVFKLKGVENLTDVNIALTSTLRKLRISTKTPRRCCIQIVSDVLLQHKALQTRKWLTGVLTELKSKGFTILAIMDPRMHSTQEVSAVLDLFDGEINIYEKRDIGKLLRIKRMTEQEYLESELVLN